MKEYFVERLGICRLENGYWIGKYGEHWIKVKKAQVIDKVYEIKEVNAKQFVKQEEA